MTPRFISSILRRPKATFERALTERQQELAQRQTIAQDTLDRTHAIISKHQDQGATADSSFISGDELLPLDQDACPKLMWGGMTVLDSDSFTAARDIMKDNPEAQGKTTVLNLASDQHPGGGWIHSLSKTQEEALCYSSTLYETLKESYYPWPNLGPNSVAGIYSPGVVIFKDDLDHNCVDLPEAERRVVSVITVAAPRGPKLTEDELEFKNESDLEDLKGKIRLVYRMAGHYKQTYLVLGAMGCGAYRCPPRLVAEQMKSILLESEFQGWFSQVVFAVYGRSGPAAANFQIFSKVMRSRG